MDDALRCKSELYSTNYSESDSMFPIAFNPRGLWKIIQQINQYIIIEFI